MYIKDNTIWGYLKMRKIYDIIIIGAGQAGIAMNYQLKQRGIGNYLITNDKIISNKG